MTPPSPDLVAELRDRRSTLGWTKAQLALDAADRIEELEATVRTLTEERDAAVLRRSDDLSVWLIKEVALQARMEAAEQRAATAEALLREVAMSGVEFDDDRIKYLTVQIDRPVWEEIAAAVAARTESGL